MDDVQEAVEVSGVEAATAVSKVARSLLTSAGSPLAAASLAAEMVADHAPESGWSCKDLEGYLEGLGPARSADFLEELAAAITQI